MRGGDPYLLQAFQSLIGRLKTIDASRIVLAGIEFQSLIGRLKTDEVKYYNSPQIGFNPL